MINSSIIQPLWRYLKIILTALQASKTEIVIAVTGSIVLLAACCFSIRTNRRTQQQQQLPVSEPRVSSNRRRRHTTRSSRSPSIFTNLSNISSQPSFIHHPSISSHSCVSSQPDIPLPAPAHFRVRTSTHSELEGYRSCGQPPEHSAQS